MTGMLRSSNGYTSYPGIRVKKKGIFADMCGNILMLVSSLGYGGAESHVASLASALQKRGHRVTVASGGGALVSGLEENGVVHVTIGFDRRHLPAMLGSYFKLRKLVKNGDFDIIHAHSRIPAFLCRFLRLRHGKQVFVTTVHARFKSGFILKRLTNWGRHTIAVSEDLRQYLSDVYGIPADNIELIPNGIDTGRFRFPDCENERNENARRIVFMSRLDRDCSLAAEKLCEAVPRLAAEFPGLEVLIAGGGDDMVRISALAHEANLKAGYECVMMRGAVLQPDEFLRANSGAVFLGVSRAALEAALCGLDVILAGNEGYGGILNPGNIDRAKAGNYCCRGCAEVTADKIYADITRLFGDGKGRRGARAAVAEYISANNCIEKTAAATELFYFRAVGREKRIAEAKEKADILLCGYYGFGNTGDDTILEGAIERAYSEYPGKNVAVIAHAPRMVCKRFGVRTLRRENIFALAHALKNAGMLVFGGGSVLQDRTSLHSLICYSALIKYAAHVGVRTELWANGLGPFNRPVSERIALSALSLCDYIGLRDGRAVSLALSLGVQPGKIVLERDLSEKAAECGEERKNFLIRKLGLCGKKFAVFSFSGGCGKKEARRYAGILRSIKKGGTLPLIVAMFPRQDGKVCRRICRMSDGVMCMGLTAGELKAILSEAEFAVGMRYHLLLLAGNAGIPFYGIGDDPKIEAVCEERWNDGKTGGKG